MGGRDTYLVLWWFCGFLFGSESPKKYGLKSRRMRGHVSLWKKDFWRFINNQGFPKINHSGSAASIVL